MLELSHHDIEWLEAISQDEDARALFLRMAALSQEGRLEPFLTALARDDELDEQTKGTVAELAGDTAFLLAVAEYLRATPPSPTRRRLLPAGERHQLGNLPVSPDPFHGGTSFARATSRSDGRSWIRTTDLRLIRAAL